MQNLNAQQQENRIQQCQSHYKCLQLQKCWMKIPISPQEYRGVGEGNKKQNTSALLSPFDWGKLI